MSGKVVIDATNPLTPDFTALTVGFTTSGGEQVARHLSSAKVVKALNTVLAPNHDPSAFPAGSVFAPVAGDDEEAVKTVVEYLSSLGFDAVPSDRWRTPACSSRWPSCRSSSPTSRDWEPPSA